MNSITITDKSVDSNSSNVGMKIEKNFLISPVFIKSVRKNFNSFSFHYVIGPILWGHSGPLSHVVVVVVDIDAQAACDSSDTW